MNAPSGWEGILDVGETILWQGRPDGTFTLRPKRISLFVFGLIFAGFALFWMLMASRAGGGMWPFGLIHFLVGIGLAIGPNIWSAYRRRHSWYTLTNRRAFIATDMSILGRRLKSYPIDKNTVLEIADEVPGSVQFAREIRRSKNGSYQVAIGFDRIPDAREVYELLRQVQRGGL